MSLERLFTVGPGSKLSAQDIFTDRTSEVASFDEAVAAVSSALSAGPTALVADVAAPRRNVLVYYGMGGVGKSTLSIELERRLRQGKCASAGDHPYVARTNFDERSALDLETTLLGIRAGLGRQGGRWRAFDLALTVYWERKHPGRPLAEFLQHTSRLRSFADGVGFAEQIEAALDTVVGSIGVIGPIWRAGHLVGNRIVERARRKKLLADCPFFAPILEEHDPDEMRLFMPVLLGWDLATQQRRRPRTAVVFLDTWEEAQAQPAEPGGVEDAIARMAYLMPNALFVVTGRNRVTWGDDSRRATLKYAGAQRWPNLAQGATGDEPRQHLLGSLSDADCEEYLRTRLVGENDEPAISEEIRRRIIDGSGGLPLYLDLCVDYFDELTAQGRTPTPDDFAGALPQIVVRVMRDLEQEERDVVRLAALARAFDRNLLRDCSSARDAVVDRFLGRSFVRDQDAWLRCGLHDTLRASIRECDHVTTNAWSEDEWREAAAAILAYLEEATRNDVPPPHLADRPDLRVVGDRDRLIQAFAEGVRLAGETGHVPDWLIQAAGALFHLGTRDVLAWPSTATLRADSEAAAIALGLRALAERQRVPVHETEARLERTLSHPTLSPLADGFFRRWLAQTLDWEGRTEEARAHLAKVVAEKGPLALAARVELAYLDVWEDRHLSALAGVEDLVGDEAWDYWVAEIHAETHHRNAQLNAAETASRAALESARRRRSFADEASAMRHLARIVAWSRPAEAEELLPDAIALNEQIEDRIGLAQCRITSIVADAGAVPVADLLTRIEESRALSLATASPAAMAAHDLAAVFVHAVDGDVAAARAARERVVAVLSPVSVDRYALLASAVWAQVLRTDDPSIFGAAEWLEEPAEVAGRWAAVLEARRSLTGR